MLKGIHDERSENGKEKAHAPKPAENPMIAEKKLETERLSQALLAF
jgi:hypothetical protein